MELDQWLEKSQLGPVLRVTSDSFLKNPTRLLYNMEKLYHHTTQRPPPQASTKFHERYHLRHSIGVGRFGKVYEAVDIDTKERVAVKKVWNNTSEEAQAEVMALTRILPHDNLIKCRGFYAEPLYHYIVVDYISGKTLQEQLIQTGPFSVCQVQSIMSQLISTLHDCHAQGMIHRDVKADNIMIREDTIHLIDFGLSTFDDYQTVCGTKGYLAPEMVRGRVYTASVDIWSAGVLAYILLTGKAPFSHENDQMLMNLIQNFWQKQVPIECLDFVPTMLQPDPLKRASAAELSQHPWINY